MSTKIIGFEDTSVASLQSKKIKEGWLKKYGGRGIYGGWKKRWIVLTEDHVFYFGSQTDKQPKSYIDLSKYSNVEESTEKKKEFSWVISNPQTNIRSFYFLAENQQETNEWLNAMKETLRKRAARKRLQAMSSFIDASRTHRSLYIKVAEARELEAKDASGTSDPYCIVQVGPVTLRTQTIWKSLAPFWGEEYNVSLSDLDQSSSSTFLEQLQNQSIVVTCFDEDLHSKDDIIGKIEIPMKQLLDQTTKEQWYSLNPVNYQNFVTGDIHLSLRYQPVPGTVTVQVIEARNLAPKDSNGLSDPFVKVHFNGEKKKSETIMKNLNPVWNYSCEFNVPKDSDHNELVFTVWDWDRIGSNDFLGQVVIPLESLHAYSTHDCWYMLSGNPALESDENSKEEKKKLGDIRLKMKYTEQKILPGKQYEGLSSLLEEDNFSIISALGDVTTEREAVAQTTVKLFQTKGKAVQLLNTLTGEEIDITPSPDVIFRGNSLATKSVDAYMKLVGLPYLHKVLSPIIKDILDAAKPCEVDPMKVEKGNVEENAKNLLEVVKKVVDAIFNSASICPIELRQIFAHLQNKVKEKYGKDHITRYTSVSGFIFLRFWGPSILGPKLFGLMKEHPPANVGRTLTLVAKTVQNLGNLVEFGGKEPYMFCMNDFIVQNKDRMKEFIDTLSTVPSGNQPATVVETVIDADLELASLFHHLSKDQEKILQSERYQQSAAVKKLPTVLNELAEAYKKY